MSSAYGFIYELYSFFFLSYLIHNFHKTSPTNRSTLRIRTTFLARNYPVIALFLNSHSKAFNLNASTCNTIRESLLVGRENFRALSRVLFSKSYTLRFTPLGINFPQSAYFWALYHLIKFSKPLETPSLPLFPEVDQSYLTYPYFQYNKIAITPVTKKPFLLTLNKFLRMSLSLWFHWPNVYRIDSNFSNVLGPYLFLRFLNKYYFKVYNI